MPLDKLGPPRRDPGEAYFAGQDAKRVLLESTPFEQYEL